MANYISERELRRLERDRRKEEMEKERDRLSRDIEERERRLQTRDMEDYRQELFRIRRERKEMRRQHELDSQKYEEQRKRLEDIERRKEDEKKRNTEMERKYEEERKRLEIERRNKYKEERRRADDIERKRFDEKENRRLEEIQRKRMEEDRLELIQRKRLEKDRGEEIRRRLEEDRLEEIQRRILEEERLQEEQRRLVEEKLLLERQTYEDESWRYDGEKKQMKNDDEARIVKEDERRKKGKERNADDYEQRPTKKDIKYIPGETPTRLMTNTKIVTQEDDENVLRKKTDDEDTNEKLRRQSESAIDKLRKTHDTLEEDIKRLNKTWTPTQDVKYHDEMYRGPALDESEEEEWITRNDSRGYETDDEIEKLGHDIEKMKLKEKRLLEEVEHRMRVKKEKEEQREREAEDIRRIEKQRKIQQLKKEQSRLFEDLRKHEETLDALNTSDSELEDSYISRRIDDDTSKPRRFLSRERQEREKKPEGHKLIVPKLPRLTEDNFEEWKVEVEVMIDSDLYQRDALLHAVRNSLSNAGKSIRNVLPIIDPKATTEEILDKLENIYGDRRPGESHLAEFYQARQTKDENVAEWGIRLETILLKAEKKGQIMREQKEQMLMKRFWKYLHDERLKLNTRILFEKSLSFEELLKEVRIEERELYTKSDSSDKDSRGAGKSKTIEKLIERMDRLEDTIWKPNRRNTEQDRDRYEATDK